MSAGAAKRLAIVGGVGLLALTASRPALAHFKADEFGLWWPLMNADLLAKLDEFRARWGHPVRVSPADGSRGRVDTSESQHNIIHTLGSVRAVDVFPTVNGRGMSAGDMQAAVALAAEVGFTGIGVYTDTEPYPMLHLDVRPGREPGSPALWSRVNGEYGGLWEAFA